VAAALGYEEVTAAIVRVASLPVMSAPPPTSFPLEQVAVEVTVAPTAAFPLKVLAVPATIVTVVTPLAPLQTYEVPLTETSFCPALAQCAPAASAVTVTL
jgi:hypothetical protein